MAINPSSVEYVASHSLLPSSEPSDKYYGTGYPASYPSLQGRNVDFTDESDEVNFYTAIGIYCVKDSCLDFGGGNDKISFDNTYFGIPPVSVSLPTTLASDNSYLKLGTGDDEIRFPFKPKFNWSSGFRFTFVNSRIDGGDGSDQICIWNAINTYIDGGNGRDIVRLYGQQKDWSIQFQYNTDGGVEKVELLYNLPAGVVSSAPLDPLVLSSVEEIIFDGVYTINDNGEIVSSSNGSRIDVAAVKQVPSASSTSTTDIKLTSTGISENSAGGTIIGTLSATVPDAGSSFVYALAAGNGTDDADNNLVTINGNQVLVKSGAVIDYETNQVLNINVQVSDNGGLSYAKAVSANVLDINETAQPDPITGILGLAPRISLKGKGLIPLTLYGNKNLNVGQIDPLTMRFGLNQSATAGIAPKGNKGALQAAFLDANRDGFLDLRAKLLRTDLASVVPRGSLDINAFGNLRDGTPLDFGLAAGNSVMFY